MREPFCVVLSWQAFDYSASAVPWRLHYFLALFVKLQGAADWATLK